ncbi:hypothetical protein TNIN_460841 [Trichonephila inaurata madagascariensis]|uniref:Uncharacterized protein n=1 Tax=Trichonephila inaurata madagascariensis TaxID=2747483 RepID=A0A8X6WQQ4_9ARAC|nr:hypothetical protein TNIN_460841 [Trichonephila inaurata madagascariensis]
MPPNIRHMGGVGCVLREEKRETSPVLCVFLYLLLHHVTDVRHVFPYTYLCVLLNGSRNPYCVLRLLTFRLSFKKRMPGRGGVNSHSNIQLKYIHMHTVNITEGSRT